MSGEGAAIKSYRDLLAWQKAMTLVELVYAATSRLPIEERYGLTSQLRRAAVSISSNIAEGHARETTKEFARCIAIARGSLAELETQIELLLRLNLASSPQLQGIFDCCDELGRILRGLRKSLENMLAVAALIRPRYSSLAPLN
jgi:four helix bundle protein